ncbi:MAG: DUF4328 domain-containing protein [Acidimicrobiia bacterium]|nr:DUF4328 domain-containing protein [Acidimicrobiia bacterium]
MSYCPRCGTARDEADQFCSSCGARFDAAGDALPEAVDVQRLAGRARVVTWLLVATAILALFSFGSTFAEMNLLQRALDGGVVTEAEANANDERQAALAGIRLMLIIATGVAWLMWQHRAQSNLRRWRPDARTTPGWAVGWWFIPFANLFMPYRTMRELWQGSTSQGALSEPSTRISLWWVAYLGSNGLISASAFVIDQTSSLQEFITSTQLAMAGHAVTIAAALAAAGIVRGITVAQLARA